MPTYKYLTLQDRQILGIADTEKSRFTIKEIKQAYNKQALRVHPDKHPKKEQEHYKAEFNTLQATYQKLTISNNDRKSGSRENKRGQGKKKVSYLSIIKNLRDLSDKKANRNSLQKLYNTINNLSLEHRHNDLNQLKEAKAWKFPRHVHLLDWLLAEHLKLDSLGGDTALEWLNKFSELLGVKTTLRFLKTYIEDLPFITAINISGLFHYLRNGDAALFQSFLKVCQRIPRLAMYNERSTLSARLERCRSRHSVRAVLDNNQFFILQELKGDGLEVILSIYTTLHNNTHLTADTSKLEIFSFLEQHQDAILKSIVKNQNLLLATKLQSIDTLHEKLCREEKEVQKKAPRQALFIRIIREFVSAQTSSTTVTKIIKELNKFLHPSEFCHKKILSACAEFAKRSDAFFDMIQYLPKGAHETFCRQTPQSCFRSFSTNDWNKYRTIVAIDSLPAKKAVQAYLEDEKGSLRQGFVKYLYALPGDAFRKQYFNANCSGGKTTAAFKDKLYNYFVNASPDEFQKFLACKAVPSRLGYVLMKRLILRKTSNQLQLFHKMLEAAHTKNSDFIATIIAAIHAQKAACITFLKQPQEAAAYLGIMNQLKIHELRARRIQSLFNISLHQTSDRKNQAIIVHDKKAARPLAVAFETCIKHELEAFDDYIKYYKLNYWRIRHGKSYAFIDSYEKLKKSSPSPWVRYQFVRDDKDSQRDKSDFGQRRKIFILNCHGKITALQGIFKSITTHLTGDESATASRVQDGSNQNQVCKEIRPRIILTKLKIKDIQQEHTVAQLNKHFRQRTQHYASIKSLLHTSVGKKAREFADKKLQADLKDIDAFSSSLSDQTAMGAWHKYWKARLKFAETYASIFTTLNIPLVDDVKQCTTLIKNIDGLSGSVKNLSTLTATIQKDNPAFPALDEKSLSSKIQSRLNELHLFHESLTIIADATAPSQRIQDNMKKLRELSNFESRQVTRLLIKLQDKITPKAKKVVPLLTIKMDVNKVYSSQFDRKQMNPREQEVVQDFFKAHKNHIAAQASQWGCVAKVSAFFYERSSFWHNRVRDNVSIQDIAHHIKNGKKDSRSRKIFRTRTNIELDRMSDMSVEDIERNIRSKFYPT